MGRTKTLKTFEDVLTYIKDNVEPVKLGFEFEDKHRQILEDSHFITTSLHSHDKKGNPIYRFNRPNMLHNDIIDIHPSRIFNNGERVAWGNHREVYICKPVKHYIIEDDGETLIQVPSTYIVKSIHPANNKRASVAYYEIAWFDLFPYNAKLKSVGIPSTKYVLDSRKIHIEQIIFMGTKADELNYTPEYQRGYVWDDADYDAFYESIFKGRPLGSLLFANHSWDKYKECGYHSEVIDGKHRINAILDFYLDKRPFRGLFYSQLTGHDKHTFNQGKFNVFEYKTDDKETKIDLFLTFNEGGVSVSKDDIDRVKRMRES